ncbi:MAG TPA: inositol 2-dehydrogenase [Woeseiaceae bacterium]|nr:inositol 2-dehydrogenase [Woeseiaceae bacterium]
MTGIAIIGAGRIGQIHAANLHQHPLAEVVCVSDVFDAAASRLAEACEASVASVDELLDDARVEAVVIASSTDSHAELIRRSAEAGKAIFCEKPLDLDVAAAEQSLSIAAKNDVLLCLGFNRRHDPSFDAIKAKIDGGQVGDVEVVSITSRDPAPPPVEYIGRSGGLFRDMMIHDFDMGRWLLGEEIVEVFAYGGALIDDAIGKAGDVDTAVAVLRTGNGRLCQITNSRRCSYGYDQRIEVFGAKGMVRADNHTATSVEVASKDGFTTDEALPFFLERYRDAYRLQLDKFLRVVRGERVNIPLGIDGLQALKIADAAQQSCDEGRPVRV